MTIISVSKKNGEFHILQSQSGRTSCWLDGYIEVPAHFEAAAWDSMGYCDLTIEDGVLTGITPTERPEIPAPEPAPTVEELQAKIAALTTSNQMLEDCLVEMAGVIYA